MPERLRQGKMDRIVGILVTIFLFICLCAVFPWLFILAILIGLYELYTIIKEKIYNHQIKQIVAKIDANANTWVEKEFQEELEQARKQAMKVEARQNQQ